MAKIQSSSEVVRQMKSELSKTARELDSLAVKVNTVKSSTVTDWNDAQGEQFRELLTKISQLIVAPGESLKASLPKLEKLAQTLDSYSRVKF